MVVGAVVALGVGDAAAVAEAPKATPVVTRAALAPHLVAGRGADVAFLEQEAENAATNGTVIGPDRTAYTLPAEASGRTAVRLAPGQHVEFTLPADANAITVRYSIPDAPNGGGITAPLRVAVNGKHRATMTLTSQYAWLYNQYPFTNDPNADLLHPDWWITECACVPSQTNPPPVISKPFRPTHFYDEQRLRLDRTYRAGDTIRLTATDGAAWTVIDLLDSELVGRPHVEKRALDVRLFGADPTGRRDAAPAIEHAIALARFLNVPVYLPPGTSKSTDMSSSTTSRSSVPATGTRSSRAVRSRSTRPRRTVPCTRESGSTAATRRTAARRTCTCAGSPSRATSASASTPTRSTASAAR